MLHDFDKTALRLAELVDVADEIDSFVPTFSKKVASSRNGKDHDDTYDKNPINISATSDKNERSVQDRRLPTRGY